MPKRTTQNKILSLLKLPGFEWEKFPEWLCVHPTKEDGVKEAEESFICLLVDDRFDAGARLLLLRPYTFTEGKKKPLYGWIDVSGQNVFDHIKKSVNFDHERVVAWKRVRR